MRSMLVVLLFMTAAIGDDVVPVTDDVAKAALEKFEREFKAADSVEAKQGVVYNLYDAPHDLVLKRLEKILGSRRESEEVRTSPYFLKMWPLCFPKF